METYIYKIRKRWRLEMSLLLMSGYLFLHLKCIFDLDDKIARNLVTWKKGSYGYFPQM